jgi:hypothetical protein
VEVVRRSGLSEPVVWRWGQERFMHEDVDGLLRDTPRPPGKASLPADIVKRIVDLMLAEPSGGRFKIDDQTVFVSVAASCGVILVKIED